MSHSPGLEAEGEDQARPDLTGRDVEGRNVILIEAKFWAGIRWTTVPTDWAAMEL